MFGMGMPEIIVILAVALIVLGPKKLPEIATPRNSRKSPSLLAGVSPSSRRPHRSSRRTLT